MDDMTQFDVSKSDLENEIVLVKRSYNPPTNQASGSNYPSHVNHDQSKTKVILPTKASALPLFSYSYIHSPWLPVSKGNIKKLAQTRFVNSSPKSYRLMPASAESSDSDRTSFVEKSFHKYLLPVSYFLEVAKLWALSNRSELECTFTLAKTDNLKIGPQDVLEDHRRPICHAKPLQHQPLNEDFKSSENVDAENELLQSVNRFLRSCQIKDKSSVFNQDISDIVVAGDVGSETRRYLSQIVSLMNKNFAAKLQSGLKQSSEFGKSRKRTSSVSDPSQCKRKKAAPRVNVFTMSSSEQDECDNEQLVIIHIPTSLRKSELDHDNPESSKSSVNNCKKRILSAQLSDEIINGSESSQNKSQSTCFYCPLSFNDKSACARHMLTHLTSCIDD